MNQETNIKIIKVAILSIPVFVMWASDFLLHIPISILLSVLGIWFGASSFILFPLKIAISVVAVYYAMKKWNKHFPPVK